MNLYGYVGNNPVSGIDPLGLVCPDYTSSFLGPDNPQALYAEQQFGWMQNFYDQMEMLLRLSVQGSFVAPAGVGLTSNINGLGQVQDPLITFGTPGGMLTLNYTLMGDPNANVPITGSVQYGAFGGILSLSGGTASDGSTVVNIGIGIGTPGARGITTGIAITPPLGESQPFNFVR